MALTQISDSGLKTPASDLQDGEKIVIGTGNDLEIYHTGGENFIRGSASASRLYIDSCEEVQIRHLDTDGSNIENMIKAKGDGAVELYYDGSLQTKTTSTGLHLADDKRIDFGTGSDLKIYHDGSHSYIRDTGTGMLSIDGSQINLHNAAGSEYMLEAVEGGAVKLYYANSNKFETFSSGVKINGNLVGVDDKKIQLGGDNDLQIWHDGTNSNITNATGTLKIGCSNNIEINTFDGHAAAKFINDGAVELYYNAEKVFYTHAEGVHVQNTNGNAEIVLTGSEGNGCQMYMFADDGDDNADKYRLDVASTGHMKFASMADGSWKNCIQLNGQAQVELFWDGSKKLFTEASGASVCGAGATGELRLRDSSDNVRAVLHGGGSQEFGWLNLAASAWTYRIEDDGDYQHYGSSLSDRDLKDNITTVTGTALDKVTKLVPKTYSWKQTPDGLTPTHKTFTGFIAQEVKEHIPSLVTGTDGQKNMALDYNGLLAHAIKAITELKAEVDTLKTKVAALESA